MTDGQGSCSRVLITGAAGRIGKARREGLRSQCPTIWPTDVAKMATAGEGEKAVQADIADTDAVEAVVGCGDAVVHLSDIAHEVTPGCDRAEQHPRHLQGLRCGAALRRAPHCVDEFQPSWGLLAAQRTVGPDGQPDLRREQRRCASCESTSRMHVHLAGAEPNARMVKFFLDDQALSLRRRADRQLGPRTVERVLPAGPALGFAFAAAALTAT